MAQLAISSAFNILISVHVLSYLSHSHPIHYWLYVAVCVSSKLVKWTSGGCATPSCKSCRRNHRLPDRLLEVDAASAGALAKQSISGFLLGVRHQHASLPSPTKYRSFEQAKKSPDSSRDAQFHARKRQNKYDHARGRTWNLLIRSQAPCHWATQPVIDAIPAGLVY
jgi:hypothetical protein